MLAAIGGCGRGVPEEAIASADALFDAVVARDRVAFEAAVDRRAVREDLRAQLVQVARANGLEVDGGPSEFALDRMIAPEALRLVDGDGRRVFEAPKPEQVAEMLQPAGKGRVCVPGAGTDCVLTFARQKGEDGPRWRLVAMRAQDLTIRVPNKETPGETARRAQGRSGEG